MAGQFDRYENNTDYWLLTPYSSTSISNICYLGTREAVDILSSSLGIRPSLNLKSKVIITSGDGTRYNPFILGLAN